MTSGAFFVVRGAFENRDARRQAPRREGATQKGEKHQRRKREFAGAQIWSLTPASRQIWSFSPGTRDSVAELRMDREPVTEFAGPAEHFRDEHPGADASFADRQSTTGREP